MSKTAGHLPMTAELTIKNYRCFVAPVTTTFGNDITAFIGVNNAGKSALMRFLLEFRDLFEHLRHEGNIVNLLNGARPNFTIRHVLDPQEAFSNLNEHGIDISINFTDLHRGAGFPTRAVINVYRDNRAFRIAFFNDQTEIVLTPVCSYAGEG